MFCNDGKLVGLPRLSVVRAYQQTNTRPVNTALGFSEIDGALANAADFLRVNRGNVKNIHGEDSSENYKNRGVIVTGISANESTFDNCQDMFLMLGGEIFDGKHQIFGYVLNWVRSRFRGDFLARTKWQELNQPR